MRQLIADDIRLFNPVEFQENSTGLRFPFQNCLERGEKQNSKKKARRAMVKFVTSYKGMRLMAFLVADEEKRGWLVNYQIEDDDFGYMCPCCMFPEHRRAIAEAVKAALRDGIIQGKVRWCCHQNTTDYGDRLENASFAPLNEVAFCAGDAHQMPIMAQAELRTVALSAWIAFKRSK